MTAFSFPPPIEPFRPLAFYAFTYIGTTPDKPQASYPIFSRFHGLELAEPGSSFTFQLGNPITQNKAGETIPEYFSIANITYYAPENPGYYFAGIRSFMFHPRDLTNCTCLSLYKDERDERGRQKFITAPFVSPLELEIAQKAMLRTNEPLLDLRPYQLQGALDYLAWQSRQDGWARRRPTKRYDIPMGKHRGKTIYFHRDQSPFFRGRLLIAKMDTLG